MAHSRRPQRARPTRRPFLRRSIREWLRPRTRGQALAEFVIILPVFLLLVVIAVDFGRLFFTYIQMTNAAREGANFAASAPTDSATISARVASERNVQTQRGEGALGVVTTCNDQVGAVLLCSLATGGAGGGNTVTVALDEHFTFLTPLVNNFFGGGLTVRASATAVVLGYVPSATATQPPACTTSPVASFTVIAQSGLTVFANPNASTPNGGICNISGYNWDWGDTTGTVGTATGDSHTYLAAGTYTITLEVTNQAGADSTTRPATVPNAGPTPTPTPTLPPGPTPTPTPVPTPTPTPIVCVKPTANFTFTTSGNGSNKAWTYKDTSAVANAATCPITDWLWTFTDAGTQSNAQNPAPVVYGGNPNATHSVTLKVTNAGGFDTITKSTP